MKKIKLLSALMALVLSASVLLTACDKKEEEAQPLTFKVAEIMNPNYIPEEDGILSASTKLKTVGDYISAEKSFLVTAEKVEATDSTPAYLVKHIYNVVTGKDVSLSEKSGDIKYYVDIISENYFAVLSVKQNKSTETGTTNNTSGTAVQAYSSSYLLNEYQEPATIYFNDKYTNTLTIRNANGDTVKTYDNNALLSACYASGSFDTAYAGYNSGMGGYYSSANSMIYEYHDASYYMNGSNDLFFMGRKLYRADKDGNMALVKDFGLSKQPKNITNLTKVGICYLGTDDSSANVYVVYDSAFNKLYEYVVPGYASGDSAYILASGELLVQYFVGLDQSAEEYDFIVPDELAQKYDLVTVLVNATGVTELTNVDYVIGNVKASLPGDDGQKIYADAVENLAFIYPIGENKYLNQGVDNRKLVLLSNTVEITAEVAIDEKISETFPQQYLNGYYRLSLADGRSYAIYDKLGNKVSELSLTFDNVNGYASSPVTTFGNGYIYDYALYDITGSQVKDLRNTNYTILGDSLFISSKTTKGASYILYVGGNTVKIGSTSTDKDDKSAFDTIACSSSYGYYYTAKSATDEAKGETVTTYTYYNEKGAKLASTTSALSAVTATDDYVVMGCREKAETKDANTGATKIEYKYTFYRFDIK